MAPQDKPSGVALNLSDGDVPNGWKLVAPGWTSSPLSSKHSLPSTTSASPPSLCPSTSSLSCLDEALNHSTDSLLERSEPLYDPFHIRSNLPETETDDIDKLRTSSAKAAYAPRPRSGSLSHSPSTTSTASRPDRRTQGQLPSMTYMADLLIRRLEGDSIRPQVHLASNVSIALLRIVYHTSRPAIHVAFSKTSFQSNGGQFSKTYHIPDSSIPPLPSA